jgi:hypothetical protein
MKNPSAISRRKFVRTAFGAGVALTAPNILGTRARAAGRTFKLGLIGCGGRGRGAAAGALDAGKILGFDVKIAATADYFKDRAVRAGEQFDLPENKCFGGADCYRKLLETDVQIILMGRISAYTGQQVTWNDMMVDPKARPEHYNLTVKPTAEDFEKGTVEIPAENVIPLPGQKA